MAEEIGIVMSLYDKVSPTLKSIAGNNKAFDKSMEELAASLKTYEQAQSSLVTRSSALKTALAATDEKVKDARTSFRKLKDETSKGALAEAIAEQGKLKQELSETETAIKANNAAYQSLYKSANNAATAASKADNRAGGGGASGGGGMLAQLGEAGLYAMAGDTLSTLANTAMGSMFGDEAGTLFSSALSGAGMGAAIGSIVPVIGTAAGAAIGGALGLVSGAAQNFEKKDDAFKGYVQESAQGQLTGRSNDIQTGSAIAAQREQDVIAFNQLLGDGVGDQYLEDLRTMAAATPMEYSDLTGMSRALATGFGGDPSRMLDLMGSIGDAGSAVGIDAAGMTEMARAMSRMESSNKASLEFLNIFQDRGVNVIGMLSEGLGKSQNQIYDMISKGKIQGVEAVDIIQAAMDRLYAGAMEKQSKTFSGLSSTLADAETEMQAAYGEGYNDERAKGIEEQTAWLTGVSGEAQQEANSAIGAWQASLENSKEGYIRNAVDAAMETEDYQSAKAAGNAAEMGRILMEAKVQGMSEYNASEGAQLALESELALVEGIRNNTAMKGEYWNAGHEMGLEFNEGLAAALAFRANLQYGGDNVASVSGGKQEWRYRAMGQTVVPYDNFPAMLHEGERVLTASEARAQDEAGILHEEAGARDDSAQAWRHRAMGQTVVPYDNFPALLHEGERVLTASEARAQDVGGGAASQIVITGNEFTVRTDADIPAIAAAIADEIVLRRLAGQMWGGSA